jgi:hypothetical protein
MGFSEGTFHFFVVAPWRRDSTLCPFLSALQSHPANSPPQVTPRRVPSSSRPAASSATPSRPADPPRPVPLFTVCSDASPARLRATPTPTPTSRRVLSGTRRLSYVPALPPLTASVADDVSSSSTSRTPRSSFPAPRWPSGVSRRLVTATT